MRCARAALRIAAGGLLAACSATDPALPVPRVAAPAEPIPIRLRFAPPLSGWTRPDPQEWGPYVRARRLCPADAESAARLERRLPECALSAWELDPCGSLPAGETRFELALVEARTRERRMRTPLELGPRPLTLLVALRLAGSLERRCIESCSIYRIDADRLVLLDRRVLGPNAPASLAGMPLGLERADGWRHVFLDRRRAVVQVWCAPYPDLGGLATHLFETGTSAGFFTTGGGSPHPEIERKPLAEWPEPVWVLTLTRAGP